jgi:hypothetical protein
MENKQHQGETNGTVATEKGANGWVSHLLVSKRPRVPRH